ncbi:RNA 2',3'-cyclic phosphodiesterase [Luteococcus peritonei]|uniref:RNA 2',3'-cyclic phosphodiesterase n=1 Tax=Luteococcus peritonei TaxID=88874 RepID=A0ABW4RT49_9ACTN
MSQRLFVAIQPDATTTAQLRDQLVGPRAALTGRPLRWNPEQQWHVTLLFTPNVRDHLVPELVDGLRCLATARPGFELALAGGGAFPELTWARHLIGLLDDPTDSLPALAQDCRSLAGGLGLEHPEGPYQPHLTLARTNKARNHAADAAWLRALRSDPWRVEEIVLVRSVLGIRGHAEHTVAATFPLGG